MHFVETPHDSPQPPIPPSSPELYADYSTLSRLGFDLAVEVGALTAEEADEHLQASLDLHITNDYLGSIIPIEQGVMTAAALAEHAVQLGTVCSQTTRTIQGAALLNSLADQLDSEIKNPNSPQVLSEILKAQGRIPLSNMLIMQKARDYMLNDVGDVLSQLCDAMLEGATRDLSQDARRRLDEISAACTEAHQLEPLEIARLAWREWAAGERRAGTPTEQELLQEVAPKLLLMYKGWRRLQTAKTGDPLGALPPFVFVDEPSITGAAEQPTSAEASAATPETQATAPESESMEIEIARLESELAQLIALHQDRTNELRPKWSRLKSEFRSFELGWKKSPPGQGADREAFTKDSRRIIGLLTVMERLGTTDEQDEQAQAHLLEELTEFFTFERALRIEVRKDVKVLRAAGREPDLSGWQQVEADFRLVRRNWDALESSIRADWPRRGGERAARAITQVLRAFDTYELELADPETFLKTVAIHLGATALRPTPRGPRSAELSNTQRYQAVQNNLDAIIGNEELQMLTRQRAEVLKHYMASASRTRQPDDGSAFGDLLYLKPSPEQPTPYFAVWFRSASGTDWIVIESLRDEKATYVFPKKLIDDQGVSIKLFIDTYNKDELRREGALQVIHRQGWTPATHTTEVQRRISAAKGPVLPPPAELER